MSETQVTTEVQFENTDDLDAFTAGFFGQKQPEPTKETKVEDEAEQEAEAQTSEDTQAQNDDEQDEAELKEEIPQKRKTVQDRIDEVVRQREEQKRESQAAIAKLQAEIDALKKGTNPVATTTSSESQEPQPDALKEDGSPVYALGEFDPQYIRDLTRHTLQQERQRAQVEAAEQQRQNAVLQQRQTLQTEWNGKLAEAVKQYPDLEQKGRDLLSGFENLPQDYAAYLSDILMSMDKGPDVLYYLSNHPDEATAIVNSGAQKATLALGRIEARFLQSEKEAPKPKVSNAPAPPPRAAQARGTNGAFIAVAPDTDDLEAFESQFFQKTRYG
jgi:hypothetical protein